MEHAVSDTSNLKMWIGNGCVKLLIGEEPNGYSGSVIAKNGHSSVSLVRGNSQGKPFYHAPIILAHFKQYRWEVTITDQELVSEIRQHCKSFTASGMQQEPPAQVWIDKVFQEVNRIISTDQSVFKATIDLAFTAGVKRGKQLKAAEILSSLQVEPDFGHYINT
jgi:hypothetical protein